MKTLTRDDFVRMMREKASTFPTGKDDEKFNNWSRAGETLINVGQPFSEYKKLKHLPFDVKKIVDEAMRELEVGKIV